MPASMMVMIASNCFPGFLVYVESLSYGLLSMMELAELTYGLCVFALENIQGVECAIGLGFSYGVLISH